MKEKQTEEEVRLLVCLQMLKSSPVTLTNSLVATPVLGMAFTCFEYKTEKKIAPILFSFQDGPISTKALVAPSRLIELLI